ncbi:RsmB/NOP family class I SAM-dependent RNA methyltransferase [Pseudahrensia aquimaris]|uniref:RsmB/NOP family class I SAM-dependent RNA methyltransferase n=1 Tax=Pseudahrensia aquimaris TaxID=744461 RepID=A0ABW3FC27_9HYPH
MRLGGRVQAAIEVLSDMEKRKRPASEALKAWGLDHRFAGSGDRSAIGNIVYDALRNRASTHYIMDSDKTRRLVLGTLMRFWDFTPDSLNAAFEGDKFAPDPLSQKEIEAFTTRNLKDAPEHVQADIPEWLAPSFQANFDEEWIAEAQAFTKRPPVDLRVNTLKANRSKVAKALHKSGAVETVIARHGLRIPAGEGASRQPNVQADAAFQKGWFEIQDEGSQIVSDLIFARPGEQVMDFCAGAGGKTLALAATMENKGQIHAYDTDKQRLKPIYERLKRAGIRNAQVHAPDADLSDLVGAMDRVFVDAPCTGTGTWRRRPDAKWKLTKESLETRLTEQEEVLTEAAPFVKPGGFFVYITCSVLPEENENQIASFLEDNTDFELLSAGEVWQEIFGFDKPQPWSADMMSITLTPASTGTDGFFFAVMGRKKQ